MTVRGASVCAWLERIEELRVADDLRGIGLERGRALAHTEALFRSGLWVFHVAILPPRLSLSLLSHQVTHSKPSSD